MSAWAELAASLGAEPVGLADVDEPLHYRAVVDHDTVRFEFSEVGVTLTLTRAARPPSALQTGFRFLPAARVGPLPRRLTADAPFDAAVAILATSDEALAALDQGTRRALAAAIDLGAWGTSEKIRIPASVTADATHAQAEAVFATARAALAALHGHTFERLAHTAFGDEPKRVRAAARGLLERHRDEVGDRALLTAIARHAPADRLTWLERIQPVGSEAIALWVGALGDQWSGAIERKARAVIARHEGHSTPALDTLAARVVAAALHPEASVEARRKVADSQRLIGAALANPEPAALLLLVHLRPHQVAPQHAAALIDRLAEAGTAPADEALLRWLDADDAASATRARDRVVAAIHARVAARQAAALARLTPRADASPELLHAFVERCALDDGPQLLWAVERISQGAEHRPETLARLARVEPAQRALDAHFTNLLSRAAGDDEVRAIKALGVVGTAAALAELEKRTGFFADFMTKSLANEAIAAIQARLDSSKVGGLSLTGSAAGGLSEAE